jgi:hypothetical protein
VLAAVAAVVVLAVAIPVGLRLSGPPPAAVDPTATGGGPTIALNYHPTWVPPGWVTTSRTLVPDGLRDTIQGEGWALATSPQDHSDNSLDFSQDRQLDSVPATTTAPPRHVTVNGRAGLLEFGTADIDETPYYVNGSGNTSHGKDKIVHELMSEVAWSPRPGVFLSVTVQQVKDGRDLVLRMARSVVADPPLRTDLPLKVGYLPAGAQSPGIGVTGTSPTNWTTGANYLPIAGKVFTMAVTWGPGARPLLTPSQLAEATRVTVRGVRGYLLSSDSEATMQVQLHGWWLVVATSGPGSPAQLVKIVDTMQIYPTAIYPWLGH